MRLVHVSPSQGRRCGIASFAQTLADALAAGGLPGDVRRDPPDDEADVLLVHHHPDFFSPQQLAELASRSRGAALVLFAHERLTDEEAAVADGIVAPYEEMAPPGHDVVAIGHPVAIPERLLPRDELRRQLGLPLDRTVLGTSGFLRFEREFDRVVERLLPDAELKGWFLLLSISPWHTPSPGVVRRLREMVRAHPDLLRLDYRHLPTAELNRRLQACDLLWCWTRASSRHYGSGVAATMYASGTRMVVARKLQHEQVLRLPNVVGAPDDFDGFVAALVREAVTGQHMRHTVEQMSWAHAVPRLTRYLQSIDDRVRVS